MIHRIKTGIYYWVLGFVSVSFFLTLIYLCLNNFNHQKYSLTNPPDFLMYYMGARLAHQGRTHDLYNYDAQHEVERSLYPQTLQGEFSGLLAFRTPAVTATLLSPLAKYSYEDAYFIFLLINGLALSLLVSTMISAKLSTVWEIPLLFIYSPIWAALSLGQISIFITLFFLLGLLFMGKDKPVSKFTSGLLFSLLFLKPNFLLLIPIVFMLYQPKKQVYYGFFLGQVLLVVLSSIFWGGFGFLYAYPNYVLLSESLSYGTNPASNFNVASIVSEFGFFGSTAGLLSFVIHGLIYLLLLIFLAVRLLGMRYQKKIGVSTISSFTTYQKAGALGLALMSSPHLMMADAAILIIPIVMCLNAYSISKLLRYTLYLLIFLMPWMFIFTRLWVVVLGAYLLFMMCLVIFKRGTSDI